MNGEHKTAPARIGLASDFDNTLYFMPDGFRQEDLTAISAFQAAGHLFGVCTGRSRRGITDVIGDRLRFDFYILENGSLILDGDLNVLHSLTLPADLCRAVLEDYVYPDDYLYVVHADQTVYGVPARFGDGSSIEDIRDMDESKIYQVSLATESLERAAELTRAINGRFPGVLTAYQNKQYIDVNAILCSKGTGVAFVRDYFRLAGLAGIGDSFNDLPMLEEADLSFTLTPSPAPIREAADLVVDHASEAIRHLMTFGLSKAL